MSSPLPCASVKEHAQNILLVVVSLMNIFQSYIFRFSCFYFISDADQPTSIDGDHEDPVVAQAFDVWRHMIKPMGLVPIYGGIGPFWVSNRNLKSF